MLKSMMKVSSMIFLMEYDMCNKAFMISEIHLIYFLQNSFKKYSSIFLNDILFFNDSIFLSVLL